MLQLPSGSSPCTRPGVELHVSMPVSFEVDREARLIRVAIRGDFTAAEMVAAVIGSAKAAKPGYNILSDHREIGTPATRHQMEQVAMLMADMKTTFGGSRCAVIVATAASFGMMRMLSVLLEPADVTLEIFDDPVDAERWARDGTRR